MTLRKRIAWLVPYPLRGSGGHRTIYQNIAALHHAGYECHVYLEAHPPDGVVGYGSIRDGKNLAETYFGTIPAIFHKGFDVSDDFDVVFATAWFTAEALRHRNPKGIKAYFIQDYESFFMPMGDSFIRARNTFRFGFAGISIGSWLAHELNAEFGMSCGHFDFCADHRVYRDLGRKRERAVCFVYQPEKPRRCSVVGGEALTILKAERPDVAVYLYGNDQLSNLPFDHHHKGLISLEACNDLYNRCQVGLCISSTNPSRVPFEMMAAGLPVVDIFGTNNLFDYNDSTITLAESSPEAIAKAIIALLDDDEARTARGRAGVEFMAPRKLELGFQQFVAYVDNLTKIGDLPSPPPVQSYHRRAVSCDRVEAQRLYEAKLSMEKPIAGKPAAALPLSPAARPPIESHPAPRRDPLWARGYMRIRDTLNVLRRGHM